MKYGTRNKWSSRNLIVRVILWGKKKSQLRDQSICHTFPNIIPASNLVASRFLFHSPKIYKHMWPYPSKFYSQLLGPRVLVSTDLYSLGAYPYKLSSYLSVFSLKTLGIDLLLITLCDTCRTLSSHTLRISRLTAKGVLSLCSLVLAHQRNLANLSQQITNHGLRAPTFVICPSIGRQPT